MDNNDLIIELRRQIADLELDRKRMDWLETKVVNVREPMVYGSKDILWSFELTDENDTGYVTKIRQQIDRQLGY